MEIQSKVVWVTGASSGIGEALVVALAKKGAIVALSSRRLEELQRVQKQAGLSEQTSLCVPLDLADFSTFDAAYQQVLEKFGRVDILINNGGISQRDYFKNTEMATVRRLMEVNFFGTVGLTKLVLPEMIARKSGMIVAVTSVTGKYGTPLRSIYAASKHALHGFLDALRAEHFDDNLKVLIVAPGYIKTNLSYNAVLGDGTAQNALDKGQANGLSAEKCAQIIIRGIKKEKREIYPAGAKELAGLYMKRFFPAIMARIVRKVNVR